MKLSVNSVNFNGKQEVIYGLKKAAQESRNIEKNRVLSQGLRPLNRTEEIAKNKSAMNAYLDMVVNDDNFVQTMTSVSEYKENLNMVGNLLKEETIQNSRIKPHEVFSKELKNVISNQKIAIKDNIVEKVINILAQF